MTSSVRQAEQVFNEQILKTRLQLPGSNRRLPGSSILLSQVCVLAFCSLFRSLLWATARGRKKAV